MKPQPEMSPPSHKPRGFLLQAVLLASLIAGSAFGQSPAARSNTATGTITTLPGPQVSRSATEQRVKAIESIESELAEVKASVQPLAESIAAARQRAENENSIDADIGMLEVVADAAFRGKVPIGQMSQMARSAAEVTDQQAGEVSQATQILRSETKFQQARGVRLREMHDTAKSTVATMQERFAGLAELPKAKREVVANALFTAGALHRVSASAAWTTEEMQAALEELEGTETRLRDRAERFRGIALRSDQTAQMLQLQAANIRVVANTWKTTRSNDEFDRQSETVAQGLGEIGKGFAEIASTPMPSRPPRRAIRTPAPGEDEVLTQLRAFPTSRANSTNSNLAIAQP